MLDPEVLWEETREECAAKQGWSMARWFGEATGLAAAMVAQHGREKASTLLHRASEAILGFTGDWRVPRGAGIEAIVVTSYDLLPTWDQRSHGLLLADAAQLALGKQ